MKKITIFILFFILFSSIIINISYSKYKHDAEITTSGTTGKMNIDVSIDSKDSYVENNVSYFIIKVTNVKNGVVSNTDIDYVLKITNINNSNGIYYLIDEEGNTSTTDGSYTSSITTKTYTLNKTAKTNEYKVYVKSNDGESSTIDYNVSIEAVQKQMG